MIPKKDSRIHGEMFKLRIERKLYFGKITLMGCMDLVKPPKQMIQKQF